MNAGIVPYNTVNSVGVRDQLISMAKVESKGMVRVLRVLLNLFQI